MKLAYGTRTKQHPLNKADAKARLLWCKQMEDVITDRTVKEWWFVDEKPHGTGGKSRCEWG